MQMTLTYCMSTCFQLSESTWEMYWSASAAEFFNQPKNFVSCSKSVKTSENFLRGKEVPYLALSDLCREDFDSYVLCRVGFDSCVPDEKEFASEALDF